MREPQHVDRAKNWLHAFCVYVSKITTNLCPKGAKAEYFFDIMPNQGLKYNVDIVMCIDCTGSMGGLLDTVKVNALKFYPDLTAKCKETGRDISELRIRVIGFRDFYADGPMAIQDSGFFNIPSQEDVFKKFVSDLQPMGGGDDPENGLEALAMAMNSEWTKGGDRRRHIICVWSDAPTHPLRLERCVNDYYPQDMPKDFNELTDRWEERMDPLAKRLILFTPDSSWSDISNHWNLVIHHPARAGVGLTDIDYDTIINTVVKSIQ